MIITNEQLARKDGAETSKQAGVEISKQKIRQRAILIAKAVKLRPGKTSLELVTKNGVVDWRLRSIVARTLPLAAEMHLVVRAERRKCTVGGRVAYTWQPVGDQADRITNLWE